MAQVRANSDENYESTIIHLSASNYPIAYRAKLEELVEQNCYDSIEHAAECCPTISIELELYYDKHSGLFGGESEAIADCAAIIRSPYTGEFMLPFDDEE